MNVDAASRVKHLNSVSIEKSGWLQKWTNYVKGYSQRWFILDSSGNFSYYRNPIEVNSSCRGSINLRGARILSETDTNQLVVATNSQSFHLKAQNELDRQEWLKALEYSRHRITTKINSNEDELDDSYKSISNNIMRHIDLVVKDVEFGFNQFKSSSERIERESAELKKLITLKDFNRKKCIQSTDSIMILVNSISQKTAELFSKMIKEYKKLGIIANNEYEQRLRLQEQIETLAHQHSALERGVHLNSTSNALESSVVLPFVSSPPYSTESCDETYHDANDFYGFDDNKTNEASSNSDFDDSLSSIRQPSICSNDDKEERQASPKNIETQHPIDPPAMDSLSLSIVEIDENNNNEGNRENGKTKTNGTALATKIMQTRRRTAIPPRLNCSLNLWSFMRNCIGKELTKIPMPVNFNEPLSFLQRVTEDLEYSHLLDQASEAKDSCEQIAYVAAYAVSSYSTTSNRTTKPFNPLLGETFEFDRTEDLGWRLISEQVSHPPPVAVHHAEGKGWIMYQETQLTSRFRGKYLSVVPVGYTHIHFKESGSHLTFQKITTTVHNIIVGKLWIDNHGEMIIQNHTTGDKCNLKFNAYSYFSTEKPRKVNGVIRNRDGVIRYFLQGYWDKYVNASKVVKHSKNFEGKDVIEASTPVQIWTINPPYPNSEKMYHFTRLAIELNEPDDSVAPTDSRRRPDQRLMEDGKWDDSNRVKNMLEEKQRQRRNQALADADRAISKDQSILEHQPRWFEKIRDPYTGSVIHTLRDDEYWTCKRRKDWSSCQDIFV